MNNNNNNSTNLNSWDDDDMQSTGLNDTSSQQSTSSKGGSSSRSQQDDSKKSGKGNQGFKSMEPEERSKIAAKGGTVAHQKGTAHEWTSKEAAEAGRKGGQNSRSNRQSTQ